MLYAKVLYFLYLKIVNVKFEDLFGNFLKTVNIYLDHIFYGINFKFI